MNVETETTNTSTRQRIQGMDLVPRLGSQAYEPGDVEARRLWVAGRTVADLDHVGRGSIPTESARGNIENLVGAAQMPLGVAGPLRVNGEHAVGTFYVPLATTEGALVRSYERGMLVVTRAGGVTARVVVDENGLTPVFCFDGLVDACSFVRDIPGLFADVRRVAEATTRHGSLLRLDSRVVGRDVYVRFAYHTADAHGMNMIMKATDAACRWLMTHSAARRYYVITGACSEKRSGGAALAGGKGKTVVAEAVVPAGLLRTYLRVTPASMLSFWRTTVLGQMAASVVGHNGHLANGLTALFIACGQDVANVTNAASGLTGFELTDSGDLYVSVTLPSLSVATVGGGTHLGTSLECLQMLGCAGDGGARRFAEVVAATALAGELSMAAAITTGEMAAAHETYGRNRPGGPGAGPRRADAERVEVGE